MTSFGERLIESAKQAQEIARGKRQPSSVYVPPHVDVRDLRKRLNLSQREFAERFGLPIGTIRDWEQGRRVPDRPAQVLLNVIDQTPDAVADAIGAKRKA